jgi:hypothetical protein
MASSCDPSREGADVSDERPATVPSVVASESFANLRQRPSDAKVRSTTHLRDRISKPRAVSERLIDDFYGPFADALQSFAQFISGIKDMAQPGIAITAGFLRRRAAGPRLADTARSGDQQIAMLGNPAASCWDRALSSRRAAR